MSDLLVALRKEIVTLRKEIVALWKEIVALRKEIVKQLLLLRYYELITMKMYYSFHEGNYMYYQIDKLYPILTYIAYNKQRCFHLAKQVNLNIQT